jgi:hypothetical protein
VRLLDRHVDHSPPSLLTLSASDRWEKLYKDLYSEKLGQFDLSKVPDVYDSIRYEVLHNSHLNLVGAKELFDLAVLFERSIVPQEYGIDCHDKRKIGSMMCHFLLEKIKGDLGEKKKSIAASFPNFFLSLTHSLTLFQWSHRQTQPWICGTRLTPHTLKIWRSTHSVDAYAPVYTSPLSPTSTPCSMCSKTLCPASLVPSMLSDSPGSTPSPS